MFVISVDDVHAEPSSALTAADTCAVLIYRDSSVLPDDCVRGLFPVHVGKKLAKPEIRRSARRRTERHDTNSWGDDVLCRLAGQSADQERSRKSKGGKRKYGRPRVQKNAARGQQKATTSTTTPGLAAVDTPAYPTLTYTAQSPFGSPGDPTQQSSQSVAPWASSAHASPARASLARTAPSKSERQPAPAATHTASALDMPAAFKRDYLQQGAKRRAVSTDRAAYQSPSASPVRTELGQPASPAQFSRQQYEQHIQQLLLAQSPGHVSASSSQLDPRGPR